MLRPIGVVVALAQERRALERILTRIRRWRLGESPVVLGELGGRPVAVIQAGIGQARARRALLALSSHIVCQAAWSVGFVGGLTDAVRPGDVVCPAVVLKDDGGAGVPSGLAPARHHLFAALSQAGVRAHNGPLLTVDSTLRTCEAKRSAHRRTGAVAVDMEAMGVAEAAAGLGTPWLAIKAVLDGVEDPLPDFLAGCTSSRGDLSYRGLVASLLAGSEARHILWRLSRAARRASLGLEDGLTRAVQVWSA
jgi:nucleoside phosphorylase